MVVRLVAFACYIILVQGASAQEGSLPDDLEAFVYQRARTGTAIDIVDWLRSEGQEPAARYELSATGLLYVIDIWRSNGPQFRPLQISGVLLDEPVEIRGLHGDFSLVFIDCAFAQGFQLTGARLAGGVEFSRCEFSPPDPRRFKGARNYSTSVGIRACGLEGDLVFSDCRMEVTGDADPSVLPRSINSNLVVENCEIDGDVRLERSRLTGFAVHGEASRTEPSDPKKRLEVSTSILRSTIGSQLRLEQSPFDKLRVSVTRIAEVVISVESSAANPWFGAIELDHVDVDSQFVLSGAPWFSLIATNSRVGSMRLMSTLSPPDGAAEIVPDRHPKFLLYDTSVEHGVDLSIPSRAAALEVDLQHSEIGSLNIRRKQIERRSLARNQPMQPDSDADGHHGATEPAAAAPRVRDVPSASSARSLRVVGCEVSGPMRVSDLDWESIDLSSTSIEGDLALDDLKVTECVTLADTRVAARTELSSVSLARLDCWHSRHRVLAIDGLEFTAGLTNSNAALVSFGGATYDMLESVRFDVDAAVLQPDIDWNRCWDALEAAGVDWDGAEDVAGASTTGEGSLLGMLRLLRLGAFQEDAYQFLERSYVMRGMSKLADAVYLEHRARAAEFLDGTAALLDTIEHMTWRYGRRPMRALVIGAIMLSFFIIAGLVLFPRPVVIRRCDGGKSAGDSGGTAFADGAPSVSLDVQTVEGDDSEAGGEPRPGPTAVTCVPDEFECQYSRLGFVLDLLIPSDLHYCEHFVPKARWRRCVSYFLVLVGWCFFFVLIYGVTTMVVSTS